jgi:hypothetical protein
MPILHLRGLGQAGECPESRLKLFPEIAISVYKVLEHVIEH